MEAEIAAIPAWWEAQYAAMVAARAAGTAPPDYVFMPDAFDVTVPPGEDLEEALGRCPPGGSVLLLPGTHDRQLIFRGGGDDKEVHVFGRGRATLQVRSSTACTTVYSDAAKATLDGLVIRSWAGGSAHCGHPCVRIFSGRLRLQACDISNTAMTPQCSECVQISGGDPVLFGCK